MGPRALTSRDKSSFGARMAPANRARLLADLEHNGITDKRVLDAMGRVPRHEFVEDAWRAEAYQNKPLPIGLSQTISQPYIVAVMTQLLLEQPVAGAPPRKRVLEIGTGSGYQTAVLAELVEQVFSVERIKALSETARTRLRQLGYRNIHFAYSDGMLGWEAHAPYDGILVAAAAADVPEALKAQLAPGGRLVIPVGAQAGGQMLRVIDRTPRGFAERDVLPVSFVPLLGGRA
jgi:protein-L-isoaspartate(D-aspartate) O-methyltransferase